jgi:hypothetical protein
MAFSYKMVYTSGLFENWNGNRMFKDHSKNGHKYFRKSNGSDIPNGHCTFESRAE